MTQQNASQTQASKGDNLLTAQDLATVAQAFEQMGRELAQMGASDRRRMCSAIVKALASTSPATVADLAACTAFTVLTVGGAK
jgi:hypothetical protein